MIALEVSCPRPPRHGHVAGNEGDGWLWFTCGPWRYEIPPSFDRLGSDIYREVRKIAMPGTSSCLNLACGLEVRCTEVLEDGSTWYCCYKCGTVGRYRAVYRETYDPADDEPHAEVLAIAADPEPDPGPPAARYIDEWEAADGGQLIVGPGDPSVVDTIDDAVGAPGDTVEQTVSRLLAEHRAPTVAPPPGTAPTPTGDPPSARNLTVRPGDPRVRLPVRRTMPTSALPRPEDIEGKGPGAWLRRREAEWIRWLEGAD